MDGPSFPAIYCSRSSTSRTTRFCSHASDGKRYGLPQQRRGGCFELRHAVGWPIPRGGSQQIANALASYFTSIGGKIVTNTRVRSLDDLPTNDALILCDVTPRQFLEIAEAGFPGRIGID
jgi:hypothetical protein